MCIDFDDVTVLTVRLTSMGIIELRKDNDLNSFYVYKRDFDPNKFSPVNEEFTFERFSELLAEQNRMLKVVLVGKDAVLVGVSNSTFQDILYRARIHPKRRASELSTQEKQSLYYAIRFVFTQRLELKGKTSFHDLYGNRATTRL